MTGLIIFPVILQTVISRIMLSIGGQGAIVRKILITLNAVIVSYKVET